MICHENRVSNEEDLERNFPKLFPTHLSCITSHHLSVSRLLLETDSLKFVFMKKKTFFECLKIYNMLFKCYFWFSKYDFWQQNSRNEFINTPFTYLQFDNWYHSFQNVSVGRWIHVAVVQNISGTRLLKDFQCSGHTTLNIRNNYYRLSFSKIQKSQGTKPCGWSSIASK